jgi:hypothetical protein
MKRRAFIGLLGASALSMPFLLSEHGLGLASRNTRITAKKNRVPLRLNLPSDAGEIVTLLGAGSRQVFLLGGTAIAAAAGVEPSYLNLLIETKKLPDLKKAMFEFGVTPVSTADLPAHFVRFIHRGNAYNVLNMSLDTYAQLSADGMEKGLILFAHNFLICSVKDGWALDPCGALGCKSGDGQRFLIKPLRQPKTMLQGFEHCLAATFDRALLGLQPSPEYDQIEERLFSSTPGPEESKEIMSLLLDYSPDILEVGGLETASRLWRAPVCTLAAKMAADIDLARVEARLRRSHRQGTEMAGRDFMGAVHEELLKKPQGKGAAQGLPEYLAATLTPFRRVEVLIDALSAPPDRPADGAHKLS